MGIHVVKPNFWAVFTRLKNPASATVPTAFKLLPPSIPDETTMLPKQARYQLRNTPFFIRAGAVPPAHHLLYIFFPKCQMFKK